MASRDQRNRAIFESRDRVDTYESAVGLTPAEEYLFDHYVAPGSRILDLGVGSGRTYPALSAHADRYVGIDYSHRMIEAARRNHPQGSFEFGDASDLSGFDDASFDVVVFSYNGLDYLTPDSSRWSALAEIHRVLRPGGTFIFSTHNPRSIVRRHHSPGRSGFKAMLTSILATVRAAVTMVRTPTFWRGYGYETDCVTGLTTYFASVDRIVNELSDAWFVATQCIGGDFPERYRQFRSPWTYVVAVRGSDDQLQTEVLYGDPGSELNKAWDDLIAGTDYPPFVNREWVEAWWETFAFGARRATVVTRDGMGQIVGILPLVWTCRPLHSRLPVRLGYLAIAGAGIGAGDHLGPVCDDLRVARTLFEGAANEAGRSSLLLENLAPRWATTAQRATDAHWVRDTECFIAIRPSDGTFAEAWKSKARKNVRRHQRRITDEGVTSRWALPGSEFKPALESLMELHRLRWESQGESGLFDADRFGFVMRLAERSDSSFQPRILLLERDGDAIAAMLVFLTFDRLNIYKTGWHPMHHRLSLGTAMGAEAMRYAEELGLHSVDYLRGTRGHKVELGCQPVADTTLIRASGPRGWLLFARERWAAERGSSRWMRRRLAPGTAVGHG